MFTLAAFYASIANGVTYSGVTAAADQSMTPDASGRLQSPGPWQIIGAHAVVPNGTAARINAPSLRSLVLPEIQPITVGTAVAAMDGPVEYFETGFQLQNAEGFQPEISRAGAGAGDCYAAVWLAPSFPKARRGKAYTLACTSAITTVKGQWVLGALTLSQSLPAGRYAVVGMAVVATGGLYARLVYPGVANYRPGVVCQGTYGNLPWTQSWRLGNGPDFGDFVFNAPPQVELFGTAAAAITASVYLDLIKV